jgi:phosphotransferase system HPr (HPr) family protein
VRVSGPHGLHALAASRIAQAVARFGADVRLSLPAAGRETADADGRSVMDILALAVGPGSQVTLAARGSDAEAVLDALEALFRDRFGER